MTNELALKSASELLALYRQKAASPSEVLSDVVAQAALVEPTINAFAEEMFEEAQALARQADDVFARSAEDARPLEGIPLAVKEKHAIRGHPVCEGTLTRDPVTAEADCPTVERLRAAGAVIHARTTTPEFSCAAFTHSRLWGITRNPWNTDYSPGGSSGGSAAALAAGATVLATASDIGGSTRIPAAFCGVVGYKPPYGRVPGSPPFFLDTYRSDGPLARTVADVALMYGTIAGFHSADSVTVPLDIDIPSSAGTIRDLRVAYAPTLGDYPVDPVVKAHVAKSVSALANAGAQVAEVSVPWSREEILDTIFAHWGTFFGAVTADHANRRPDVVTDYARAFGQKALATVHYHGSHVGLAVEARMQLELARALRDFDVLICPTIGTLGFPAGDDLLGGIHVDGVYLHHYLMGVLTTPFNICNRSPVMSVPAGVSDLGLPVGIQIVGKPYDEPAVFRTAYAIEAIRPWQTTATI